MGWPPPVISRPRLARGDHRGAEVDARDRAARALAEPSVRSPRRRPAGYSAPSAGWRRCRSRRGASLAAARPSRRGASRAGLDLGDGRLQHRGLDSGARPLSASSWSAMSAASPGSSVDSSRAPRSALADAAAGIDPRPQDEAGMIGVRAARAAGDVGAAPRCRGCRAAPSPSGPGRPARG